MDLQFGDVSPGIYGIVTADALATKAMSANVSLLHRKNGEYAENYPAVGGTVTLDSAPSVAAAKSGQTVTVQVHAQFALHALQQLGCNGGEAVDGSVIDTQCTCRDPEGTITTCIPDAGFNYCCPVADAETVPFDLRLEAQPCAAMCRVAVGLSDYCAAVNP